MKETYGYDLDASVKCSNFIGETNAFVPIRWLRGSKPCSAAIRRKSISNGKRIIAKQILFPQKEVQPNGKTE